MEDPILITWLNDFIFCPASIYFHNLYGETERIAFQQPCQLNGTAAHERIDSGKYSTRKNILSGIPVYCEKYNLTGKIDLFDMDSGELVERKKQIKTIYDGYVFQLYGQCFALREMGYTVRKLTLRSLADNKKYPVPLPENAPEKYADFENLLHKIETFDLSRFKQTTLEKCLHCIYEPLCSASLAGEENV